MRTRLVGMLAGLLLAATPQASRAQDLNVGDKAPPLTVSKFVKGEPVSEFQPGKLYVVEFWATWCGPCRQTIPHLTELQKKYENVTFIGVDVYEPDTKDVAPFVKEMGEKMDYRVALDSVPEGKEPQDGQMAKNWMDAADEGGIPTAFIVNKEGLVAWIGHPIELEEPLTQILKGDYDLAAVVKERQAAKENEKRLADLMTRIQQADGPKDIKALMPELDKIIAENKEMAPQLSMMKFNILMAIGEEDDAVAAGEKLLDSELGNEPQILNNVAWTLVGPERASKPGPKALKLAARAAEKADKLTNGEDWALLDTLARVQFLQGDAAKALATQQKAVKLAGDAAEEDPDLKGRLEEYRKAAAKAGDQ